MRLIFQYVFGGFTQYIKGNGYYALISVKAIWGHYINLFRLISVCLQDAKATMQKPIPERKRWIRDPNSKLIVRWNCV